MSTKTPFHVSPPRSRVHPPSGGRQITEQSHRQSCDIHHILRKAREGGVITHLAADRAQYGNFIGAPDFIAAQEVIARANTMFSEVPSRIRERFKNDPAQYLDFCMDPRNRDELLKLKIDVSHLPEPPAPQEPPPPKPE